MTKTFDMYRGLPFLGSRGTANIARCMAEDFLRADSQAKVVFDFSGVKGVSHGYADESITPLNELLGPVIKQRVVFENCDDKVEETFRLVCGLHSLQAPAFAASSGARS